MSRFYTTYVTSIFIVKILFISLAITHLVLSRKSHQDKHLDKQVVFWKDHIEFIFSVMMSILLLYIFTPGAKRYITIDRETRLLFFLFGAVLLATANWTNFLHNSPTINHYINLLSLPHNGGDGEKKEQTPSIFDIFIQMAEAQKEDEGPL